MEPPISLELWIMVRIAFTRPRALSQATLFPACSLPTASAQVTSQVPSRSQATPPTLCGFHSYRQRFPRLTFPTIKPAARKHWSFRPIRQRMRGDTCCSSNSLSRQKTPDCFAELRMREEAIGLGVPVQWMALQLQLEMTLDEFAELFAVFVAHVNEFDAAAIRSDIANDGGEIDLTETGADFKLDGVADT